MPRRYTVKAGKSLVDGWSLAADGGAYDHHVLGPGGFLRRCAGVLPTPSDAYALPEVELVSLAAKGCIEVHAWNAGALSCVIKASPNASRSDRPFSLELHAEQVPNTVHWSLGDSGYWYDFNIVCPALPGWPRRFAGRLETGPDVVSDPALGSGGRA